MGPCTTTTPHPGCLQRCAAASCCVGGLLGWHSSSKVAKRLEPVLLSQYRQVKRARHNGQRIRRRTRDPRESKETRIYGGECEKVERRALLAGHTNSQIQHILYCFGTARVLGTFEMKQQMPNRACSVLPPLPLKATAYTLTGTRAIRCPAPHLSCSLLEI